ncbi:hypothetical protein K2173_025022 [Erythroxylum novogranatense]|uniref:Uncharacterized protein n=1 Tax=Erythroxylum novogranatense TaxID=1862640 RepID=A0AAV8UGN1_9ROSI|nr:hypothetical protein K2173_025022 [Erythroxylum novogranatense]
MYTETKNNKKLKQLHQKALAIKSAIPHPRIMGIIRECGGNMHMAERQRIQCLKIITPSCQILGLPTYVQRMATPMSQLNPRAPDYAARVCCYRL